MPPIPVFLHPWHEASQQLLHSNHTFFVAKGYYISFLAFETRSCTTAPGTIRSHHLSTVGYEPSELSVYGHSGTGGDEFHSFGVVPSWILQTRTPSNTTWLRITARDGMRCKRKCQTCQRDDFNLSHEYLTQNHQ